MVYRCEIQTNGGYYSFTVDKLGYLTVNYSLHTKNYRSVKPYLPVVIYSLQMIIRCFPSVNKR